MLKQRLKANYKALPPAEKLKRNLLSIGIWLTVSALGLFIFKSGSSFVGVSVIFIGIIGIIESAIRAAVNLYKSKKLT